VFILNATNFSTKQKLLDYVKPVSKVFEPGKNNHRQSLQASGGQTPMPDWSFSTPAWNPSAQTPVWVPQPAPLPASDCQPQTPTLPLSLTSPVASTSQIATMEQEPPQHFLLNPLLIGVTLKVTLNGGEYVNKDVSVSIVEENGHLSIRYSHYNISKNVEPGWISLKHPTAARDNGLCVVIKDEHFGKYVRRIHHQYENGKGIMIAAVVKRMDGSVDILSMEQLELPVEYLCLCSETKADRQAADSLLASSREKARKK
jgi:hypothetical protein